MLFKILLTISMILLSSSAYAQFGLDKLKEKAKETISDPEKAKEDVSSVVSEDEYARDYGMTDAIHANHLREICFSKTPIWFENGKEEQLAKEFTLGVDNIYFMAYFERCLYNQMLKDGKKDFLTDNHHAQWMIFNFEVNGKEIGKTTSSEYRVGCMGDQLDRWTGYSSPNVALTNLPNPQENSPHRMFNTYVVPELKEGANKIKFLITYEGEHPTTHEKFPGPSPMATGEFTLKVNKKEDIKNHLLKKTKLFSFCSPDQEIMSDIQKAFAKKFPDKKVLKFLVNNDDWVINKTALDAIDSRSVMFHTITKKDDGSYFSEGFLAEQKYQGAGKYGKTIFTEEFGGSWVVPDILMK